MAEANQNNCNINDNLWQWGSTLIAQYNQRIDDQLAAEQRMAQAQASKQNQASWMDVMTAVIKGVQDVQTGQDRHSGQDRSSGGHALPSSIPLPAMDTPPMPGMGGVVYVGAEPFGSGAQGPKPQGNAHSGGSTGSGSSSPPSTGGMSAKDCELHFCPVCAKAVAGVDLMGVAVSPQCNDCRKKYSSKINDCVKGGRTDRPASSTSQFNTYSVVKCKKPMQDSRGKKNGYYYLYYEVTGPDRNRTPSSGFSCQLVSKGSWKACLDQATNLNERDNTHFNVVP